MARCMTTAEIHSMAINAMDAKVQCGWGEHLADCKTCRDQVLAEQRANPPVQKIPAQPQKRRR